MAGRYDRSHIDVTALAIARRFKSPRSTPRTTIVARDRKALGARLGQELGAAFNRADAVRPAIPDIEPVNGVYLEVELPVGKKEIDLERRRDGVRQGAERQTDDGKQTVLLFVPDDARVVLQEIISNYTDGALTKVGQNPPNASYIEQIGTIREARLRTFWTDEPALMPTIPTQSIWWELWCWSGNANSVEDIAKRLGCHVAPATAYLKFPEVTVIPVHATLATIELLLFATGGIAELRQATDTPAFFTAAKREDQIAWTDELSQRIVWPADDAPSVCLLDTGVNRAHPLIEPALSPGDLKMVIPEWGGDDHDVRLGHGTGMAGLALHGDLEAKLASTVTYTLKHRLESVKFLPPAGFDANDPNNYGAVTQSAVAIAEINRPDRQRVFCHAVTNLDMTGERPTAWSAAIDQAASGSMIGDGDGNTIKRLFVVSAGNIPDTASAAEIKDSAAWPIEDPAQSWNALAVGGFTDRMTITETDLTNWSLLGEAGGLSPYSRTSLNWAQGRCPFKPDLVMEAGNRAVSPTGNEVASGVDSLSLVTTGRNVDTRPLESFWATSAATAQVAKISAEIMAEQPNLWPESVRALLVHSADWTPAMIAAMGNGKRDSYAMLRRFGYGTPDLRRALNASQSDLALLAQNSIQPFHKSKEGPRFGEAHFYPLPWPGRVFEELENIPLRVKVTLSYFIEPNPGSLGAIDPQRYQSFGLRFDLKRSRETQPQFVERVNADTWPDRKFRPYNPADDGWWFGAKSVSCGSLHCDVWEGPAVELATRNLLCVYPVIGWWRERAHLGKCNNKARYSLVVSISSPTADIDIHTPISASIKPLIDVAVEIPGGGLGQEDEPDDQ